MSSQGGGFRTVPANGPIPPAPPAVPDDTAVLGVQVARAAPPPARPLGNTVVGAAGTVLEATVGSGGTLGVAGAVAALLPPDQLACVQRELAAGIETGMVPRDLSVLGPTELLFLARQCHLDLAKLAPVLAQAVANSRGAAATSLDGRATASPRVDDGAPSDQRLARMRAATAATRSAQRPAANGLDLPLWQAALLAAAAAAGLGSAVYWLAWRRRPRIVPSAFEAPRAARRPGAARRPARPRQLSPPVHLAARRAA